MASDLGDLHRGLSNEIHGHGHHLLDDLRLHDLGHVLLHHLLLVVGHLFL